MSTPRRASRSCVVWGTLLLICAPVACAQTPAATAPAADASPYSLSALNVSELTFSAARATDEERRLIQGVIDGLYPGVVQIHSGRVRITGVTRSSNNREEPYEADLLFDGPTDCMRWNIHTLHGDYAFGRNEEESYTIPAERGDRKVAMVKARNEPPAVAFARPLDPRGLPYSSMMLLKTGMSLEEFWRIKERCQSLDRVQRFRRLDDSALEIVMSIPMPTAAAGQMQRESWSRLILDDRCGGHPVLAEEWLRQAPEKEPDLNWRSSTEWKEIDSQWAPVAWETNHPGRMSAALKLDWKAVNREIPATEFELSSIELPKGSSVWDFRLGEKLLHERVGGTLPTARPVLPPPTPPFNLLRTVLVVVNMVGLIAILLIALRRRRTSGSI